MEQPIDWEARALKAEKDLIIFKDKFKKLAELSKKIDDKRVEYKTDIDCLLMAVQQILDKITINNKLSIPTAIALITNPKELQYVMPLLTNLFDKYKTD